MRGPVSPDGKLAAHPECDGQAAVFFSYEGLEGSIIERALANDSSLLLLGRSVLGQLGVDIQQSGPALGNGRKEAGIWVPLQMEAHTPVGRSLAQDISELLAGTEPGSVLQWRGDTLPFGRFADLQRLVRLEADEVQHDIDEAIIYVGSSGEEDSDTNTYRVNNDGSLSVKVALLEFKLNTAHLHGTPAIEGFDVPEERAPAEVRLELLHRGRAGIKRHSWTEAKRPDEPLPDFFLGGIPISPGGRYWNIRKRVADNVYQLPSAAFLDGNRIDGVGTHRDPYYRNRQVELRSTGWPRPTLGDTWPTLDIYRSKEIGEESSPTNWMRMTPEARRARHELGVTALQALETEDQATREALFNVVRRPDIAAFVLSRRGIRLVSESGSHDANRRNIKTALRRTPPGIPKGLEHLQGLIEKLQEAGDRTSTVVADKLRLEHLPDLVDDGGASAILAEEYVGENGSVTRDELALLTSLSRQNIGIAQAKHGDYREFHPIGLWVKPGVAERLRQSDMLAIALFGAARPWIGEQFDAEIGELMDGLIEDEGGSENLAFVHGNGGGTMWSACLNARKRHILSLGTGIDAERNGQGKVNNYADGVINMDSMDWIVRQHQLDAQTLVAMVVKGAYGTAAEIFNTITSRKLLIRTPAPMFIRNPDGEFDGIKQQIRINTSQDSRPNAARSWVGNTVHFINSLSEARPTLADFRRDMTGYWDSVGIPAEHIAKAYETRRNMLGRIGLKVPLREEKAVKAYAGHLLGSGAVRV